MTPRRRRRRQTPALPDAHASVSRRSRRSAAALQAGELAIFDESNAPNDFHAETDVELVGGQHPHDLVLGRYSVHTSAEALREGEARIRQIGSRLRATAP